MLTIQNIEKIKKRRTPIHNQLVRFVHAHSTYYDFVLVDSNNDTTTITIDRESEWNTYTIYSSWKRIGSTGIDSFQSIEITLELLDWAYKM